MQRYSVLIKLSLVVLFGAHIGGCGQRTAEPVDPESLPPRFSQALVVKNKTAGEISLFPAPGSIGEPLTLKADESITVNFIINRTASVDESGNPAEDGWRVEIDKQHKYLGMKGADGVLRIKTSNGRLWDYRIVLGSCWFENRPPGREHELNINERGPDQSETALLLCE